MQLVLATLHRDGRTWLRALEPTCGLGSFIRGLCSLPAPPQDIQAVEIQPPYVDRARLISESLKTKINIRLHQGDLFQINLAQLHWVNRGPLLVVGNPPWVTNSELGVLESGNLPTKSNIKALRGIDAMTGDSNFDIAEYIWIKLIKELAWARPTIALLCKTSVARNVLKFAQSEGLPISGASVFRIDAKKWFGASTDACLFKLDVGSAEADYSAAVYSDLTAAEPESLLSISNGSLVANTDVYNELRFLDGNCALEWRQGIKHDLAAIMELRETSGVLRNKLGETVDIEEEFTFPLIKSSDLQTNEPPSPRFRVIVTQKSLADDTGALRHTAPRLWSYLNKHIDEFRSRKSSIYFGRPDFAMFGIGSYSFSPFKVAVSGLYKTARFRVLRPFDDRPILLDDTCYFVACETLQQACVVGELLNHDVSIKFLNAIVFSDSKRPFTKKALQRLDIEAVLSHIDSSELLLKVNSHLEHLGAEKIPDAATLHAHVTASEQQYQQFTLL